MMGVIVESLLEATDQQTSASLGTSQQTFGKQAAGNNGTSSCGNYVKLQNGSVRLRTWYHNVTLLCKPGTQPSECNEGLAMLLQLLSIA